MLTLRDLVLEPRKIQCEKSVNLFFFFGIYNNILHHGNFVIVPKKEKKYSLRIQIEKEKSITIGKKGKIRKEGKDSEYRLKKDPLCGILDQRNTSSKRFLNSINLKKTYYERLIVKRISFCAR